MEMSTCVPIYMSLVKKKPVSVFEKVSKVVLFPYSQTSLAHVTTGLNALGDHIHTTWGKTVNISKDGEKRSTDRRVEKD